MTWIWWFFLAHVLQVFTLPLLVRSNTRVMAWEGEQRTALVAVLTEESDPFERAGHFVRGATPWDVAVPFTVTEACPCCGVFGTHYLTRMDARDPGVYRECVSCGHVWNERFEGEG